MKSRHLICFSILLGATLYILIRGSAYDQSIAILAGVFTLLGVSVNLVFGYLGYISFGHAAFFGLGGYTAGLVVLKLGIPYWPAVFLATLPGAALGILVGYASLRIGGAYFAITSLTAAEILRLVADNWIDLTRGPMGLLVPRPTISVLEDIGVRFEQYYLLIVVFIVALVFFLVARIMRSPVGRAWLAIRESIELGEAIGIPTLRFRVLNLAFSGGVASLAGALLVPKILVLSPDLFSPIYSATGLLVVVLGGKGTLIGPLVGGILFAWLPEALRFIEDFRLTIFAVLLLLFIRLQPNGIAPLILRWLNPAERKDLCGRGAKGPAEAWFYSNVHSTEKPVLDVNALTKYFDGLVAVRQVSFTVMPGQIVGLMGPNGAGKTTCLNLISGFLKPSSGEVTFAGTKIVKMRPNRIAALGLVRTFQHTTLFRGSSVLDNTLMATHKFGGTGFAYSCLQTCKFRKEEQNRREIAWRALDLVGLTKRATERADSLAYGEQRLLSLALALAAGPKLLLLDEPAAGFNPTEAEDLASVLRRLRGTGVTILLVEHNITMMMSLCERIIVMHHGEQIAEGTPTEIQSCQSVRQAFLGEARKG